MLALRLEQPWGRFSKPLQHVRDAVHSAEIERAVWGARWDSFHKQACSVSGISPWSETPSSTCTLGLFKWHAVLQHSSDRDEAPRLRLDTDRKQLFLKLKLQMFCWGMVSVRALQLYTAVKLCTETKTSPSVSQQTLSSPLHHHHTLIGH